ncbi:MAG: hypothetical protein ABDH21_06075 [bacterium]
MVKKEPVRIIAITDDYRVEGYMYIIPGGRIVDELNKTNQFLPLTDCIICDKNTSLEIEKVKFMALNKDKISILFPADEVLS